MGGGRYRLKRRRIIRFSGCNIGLGAFGRRGCGWCDSKKRKTPHAIKPNPDYLKIVTPTNENLRFVNPVEPSFIAEWARRLYSPDTHAISLTGGEPLFQPEFLASTAESLKNEGFKLYLETNGSMPAHAARISHLLDYCCCDIKDESAGAAENWRKLVELELETIKILSDAGVAVFAKVVVTSNTKLENVEWYSRELSRINCPICIQPVTPKNGYLPPSFQQLCIFTEAAARYLGSENVSLSVQTHKFLGIL
ncbi:MAG: 7-carboxy-7-deazaguanine synthase QueE [Candidatus Jordarchaeales archaeon]|nr:7-carboxy-7-deazaguanine synthase QueE [Candidatus Jordarchaeia archaeon]